MQRAPKQWFVMTKDTNGRFENNPLWGDSWGWALFKMDGDGKMPQLIIRPIASAATYLQKIMTGYRRKGIQLY